MFFFRKMLDEGIIKKEREERKEVNDKDTRDSSKGREGEGARKEEKEVKEGEGARKEGERLRGKKEGKDRGKKTKHGKGKLAISVGNATDKKKKSSKLSEGDERKIE